MDDRRAEKYEAKTGTEAEHEKQRVCLISLHFLFL